MAKTVLDNCDNHALWTPSDAVNFPPSQDEADKQEGTGSIKVIASSDLLAALPQSANVQGYWKLEEESGNRTDISGNNNTLADYNTVLFGAGKIGSAADFELNNNEYLSRAHADCPTLRITGNLTICTWIKPETVPASGQASWIISKWLTTANNRSYGLLLFHSGSPKLYLNISSNGTASTGVLGNTTIIAGTWYHIAGVYNGSTLEVYVNGISDCTPVEYSDDIADKAAAFQISGQSVTESYYDGLADEPIIWNAALSPTEVLAVKNITGSCLNDYITRDLGA